MTATYGTELEQIPPDRLRPWPGNARTHSRKQLRQIADSIRTFGFTNPVLIDEGGSILAGHGRVEAAKMLGCEYVPCRRIETMTPAQKRAYVMADNKLALNAGWDEEILATELQGLLATELEFEIGVTGFSIPEIDSLIEGLNPKRRATRSRTSCRRWMTALRSRVPAISGSWVRTG